MPNTLRLASWGPGTWWQRANESYSTAGRSEPLKAHTVCFIYSNIDIK